MLRSVGVVPTHPKVISYSTASKNIVQRLSNTFGFRSNEMADHHFCYLIVSKEGYSYGRYPKDYEDEDGDDSGVFTGLVFPTVRAAHEYAFSGIRLI